MPLRDVPIRFLLIAGFLFSGLLPLMAVALLSFSIAREELTHQASRQLESVRDIKKAQLESFFDERVRQINILASNPYVKKAFNDFKDLLDSETQIRRRGLVGEGNFQFKAPTAYLELHDRYYEFFRKFQRELFYYDLFLMSPSDGFTYFTVKKEADFGRPISPIESSLKDVWKIAVSQSRVSLSDTRPYAPSGNVPAQFVAAPVMSEGRVIGVVAAQLSLSSITDFIETRPGMGKTGETYLVGPDFRMRSDSYRDPENHSVMASFLGNVEENGVDTLAIRNALKGRAGTRNLLNYKGKKVLSAYAPVTFQGLSWVIVAEMGEEEINEAIAEALNDRITITILISLAMLLVLAFGISIFISKGVARVKTELNLLIEGVLAGQNERRGDPVQVAYDFRGVMEHVNALIDAYQSKTNESRKLEGIIAYNERMESIGTLAGGIAHDFNNILAYMLTYGDLVLEDLEKDSKAHERMLEILKGIDRAGELVAQIMTFGRQLKREKRPVEMSLIVKEAAKLLKATIPKNIKVMTQVTPGRGKVMADPPQLHRIVMNLCTNAFQSMLDGGGEMKLSLEEVSLKDGEVEGLSSGIYALFSVSDTGCGIEPEILDRIFEPFFTTKPVGQGNGMGLAVVHGIVESYSGSIVFESVPNIGTNARVYLPIHDEAICPEEGPVRAKIVRGSGRILFVDDEEPICQSTALMIESLGYVVDAETDPEKALERFSEDPQRFVALVTDINMPNINGVELTHRMRSIRPDLPVMLITGYNDLMTPTSASKLKAEVLLKPFKKSEFSQVLSRLIQRSL